MCEKERAFTYTSMHNILSSLQQDNETKSELKYIQYAFPSVQCVSALYINQIPSR